MLIKNRHICRLLCLLTAFILCFGLFSDLGANALTQDVPRKDIVSGVTGRSFTRDSALAEKLDNVFEGRVALFSNTSETFKLMDSLDVNRIYYVANQISGMQCYIYANAVYYYLFGDLPFKGYGYGGYFTQSSTIIPSDRYSASYEAFSASEVGLGAYLRTTGNADGSYNGDSGHSIIILSYDSESITYLDANSNYQGLICVNQSSWDDFNSTLLTKQKRVISHIVQPDATKGAMRKQDPSEALAEEARALLKNIAYYGDPDQCKMTAQQAVAFMEVIRREQEKEKQYAISQGITSDYVFDTEAALVDTGNGIPALLFFNSTNYSKRSSYSLTGGYNSLWQWIDGKAKRFSPSTEWNRNEYSGELYCHIYSNYILACFRDIAMVRGERSLAVYPFRNGRIASSPTTTAYEKHDGTGKIKVEEYRIDGKTVSESELNTWLKQYGTGELKNTASGYIDALAGFTYAWQGAYQVTGMTPVSRVLSVLEQYAIGTAVAGFIDVLTDAYYAEPVKWAVDKEITNGIDKTHFGPNAGCTRGQVVTFLWRAAGCPEPKNTKNPFRDVKKGAYYYDAVLWAVEQGITNGMSPASFAPNATCTRGQIVTFLYRANGSPAQASGQTPFRDVKPSAFYYDAVLWAVKQGITNGTSKTAFSPGATCTRGQVVTFLYRAS